MHIVAANATHYVPVDAETWAAIIADATEAHLRVCSYTYYGGTTYGVEGTVVAPGTKTREYRYSIGQVNDDGTCWVLKSYAKKIKLQTES